ncbi:MAG: thymidine phosphorylase [Candidatus Latescibacterota bacterium]|nr:MAG: thymidine phosphorylase [Candidatus Latescibacterota bacterium]
MSALELVERKKRGGSLSRSEISSLVDGFTRGHIPDYQMAAFLMAVWFRGLDAGETLALTESMMRSGRVLDLARIPGPKIDKHSTGGVGDKVSLPLIGIAMACGVRVPMLSGRALGHTGGTLDKLESIPGYVTAFDAERYERLLRHPGGTIVGQSDDLVPADRDLYALRDVTATVDCVPLIVASILSKKFAAGVDGVVLDVKVGSGAFMRDMEQARELARALVAVGAAFGRPVSVLFTRMDEPLGEAVGNAVEVVEAVEFLRGGGPEDLREVTFVLVAEMLRMGGLAASAEEGVSKARAACGDGSALACFRALVEGHGGRLDWDAPGCGLDVAPVAASLTAPRRASLAAVDGRQLGLAVVDLGGGRKRKQDLIDARVGLRWRARIGDVLEAGAPVADILAPPGMAVDAVRRRVEAALTWSDAAPPGAARVLGRYPDAG